MSKTDGNCLYPFLSEILKGRSQLRFCMKRGIFSGLAKGGDRNFILNKRNFPFFIIGRTFF